MWDIIAKALKAWQFDIAGYVGYERAVVTAGGVVVCGKLFFELDFGIQAVHIERNFVQLGQKQ